MSKRFKPQYLHYNYDARALVQTLAAELGLTLKGKTGAKHNAILASFLFYAQPSDADTIITWSGGTTSKDTTGFLFFPPFYAKRVERLGEVLDSRFPI